MFIKYDFQWKYCFLISLHEKKIIVCLEYFYYSNSKKEFFTSGSRSSYGKQQHQRRLLDIWPEHSRSPKMSHRRACCCILSVRQNLLDKHLYHLRLRRRSTYPENVRIVNIWQKIWNKIFKIKNSFSFLADLSNLLKNSLHTYLMNFINACFSIYFASFIVKNNH